MSFTLGEYRSDADRWYTAGGKEYSFNVKEVIEFHECREAPQFYRVKHSGYYVTYNENELTTRYVMVSNTEPAEGKGRRVHSRTYYCLLGSTASFPDSQCKASKWF